MPAVAMASKLFNVSPKEVTPQMVKKTEECMHRAALDLFSKQSDEKQLELVKFQAELQGVR